MLNRRLARVRVLQGLYALEKARGANFLMAQDLIAEAFAPDLNSMEIQDRTKLTGKTKLAQAIFEDQIKGTVESVEEVDIKAALAKATVYYNNQNKKDLNYHIQRTAIEAEKTYDVYLLILNLIVKLAERPNSVLQNNRVIIALTSNVDLETLSKQRSISFNDEGNTFINTFYNDAITGNQHFEEYNQKVNKTLENDLAIIKYMVKNLIFKHASCEDFFEKAHLHWLQDKDILRTMIFHSFDDFITSEKVNIEVLDDQWADTKDFLKTLFLETATRENELKGLIEPKLINWNLDRIMETDFILLKMAIAELMVFPSIPVKVTINEIIEIAKDFSSEKSRIFLNGILDKIYKEMTEKGLITKSGRGMLDNR